MTQALASSADTTPAPDVRMARELETLRDSFFEYTKGEMSEKDFKAAVSSYSISLRRARESAPDSGSFIKKVRAAAEAARTAGGLL